MKDMKELKLINDATLTRYASTIKIYLKKSNSLSKIKQNYGTTISALQTDTRDTFVKVRSSPKFLTFVQPNLNKCNEYFLIDYDIGATKSILLANGFKQGDSNSDWILSLQSGSVEKKSFYWNLTQYQKVNHFPFSNYITKKDLMYQLITKLKKIHGSQHFEFLPRTFILPDQRADLESEICNNPSKLWFIKPLKGTPMITNNLTQLSSLKKYICCDYIQKPFVIEGLKFDIRIYVAITSINPLRIYIHNEVRVRATSTANTYNMSRL